MFGGERGREERMRRGEKVGERERVRYIKGWWKTKREGNRVRPRVRETK